MGKVNTEDLAIKSRSKEIFDCINHDGWKHIEQIFEQKINSLENIRAFKDVPPDQLHQMMSINLNVAECLREILAEIKQDSEVHERESVDEIRVYGASDFGSDY